MQLNYGNLLNMAKNGEFDVIIQGCNCFHTMGAGIAKYIKQDFPEAFEADKQTKYADKNKIGTFSEATVERNGHKFVVINAYTQYKYGGGVDNFEYDSFPSLLQSIKAKYGDKRIGLPLIGCGLAGGDEPRILKMIKDNFEGVNYKLVEIDTTRKLNLGNQEDLTPNSNQDTNNDFIAFTKVSLPYGWMGNMAPYPVTHEGVEYKTTDALFQSLRFINYPEIQKEIREQKSPMSAKMVAKANKELLHKDGFEFLGEQDIQNMKLCIQLKLEQHPELAKQLLETGDTPIIEDCSSRPRDSGLFWGAAYQNNQWVGKNILGNILMEARNQLKNQNIVKEEPTEYTYFFHLTSPFSNFHPSKFEYKEFTFISNEQFMMFSKAKTFNDEATAQKIIFLNNEKIAQDFLAGKISRKDIVSNKELTDQWNNLMKKTKSFGREVKNYDDSVWVQKREKVVLFGLRLKVNQNPDIKQILLDTGNSFMVEASPYDKIWGCGLSANDAKKTPPDKWPGLNLLGKVFNQLKAELRNESIKRPKP